MNFIFFDVHSLAVLYRIQAKFYENIQIEELFSFDFVQFLLDILDFTLENFIQNEVYSVMKNTKV